MHVNEKMKEIAELFEKRKKEGKKTTLRFFKDSGYLDAIEETGVDLIDPHNREMGYAENFCLCLSLDLSNGYEPYLDCEILCIDDWGTSIFIFTESLEPELSIGDFRYKYCNKRRTKEEVDLIERQHLRDLEDYGDTPHSELGKPKKQKKEAEIDL
jgi:hypothetical protein